MIKWTDIKKAPKSRNSYLMVWDNWSKKIIMAYPKDGKWYDPVYDWPLDSFHFTHFCLPNAPPYCD